MSQSPSTYLCSFSTSTDTLSTDSIIHLSPSYMTSSRLTSVGAEIDSESVSGRASCLPIELWERIIAHLDIKDLVNIRTVSRVHLAITQTPSFRARYFLYHHMRCAAIFEASHYPFMFSIELFRVSSSSIFTARIGI